MNFSDLLNNLVTETTQFSLDWFSPELALSGTILVLLLMRLFSLDRWIPSFWVALAGTVAAFLLAFFQFKELQPEGAEFARSFFGGVLLYDQFTVFFRLFILLFLVLVIALTILSGIPDEEDGPDFYTLLLGSAVGMLLMASANNLLILFLGIEMASVPSYVLVGFLKGRKPSSEGALKFVVYGAGAAGIMLYGISLIAGTLGTADMSLLSQNLNILLAGEDSVGLVENANVRVLLLGMLMVMVGLCFKLSIFPFHFWTPDAFEGAAAEVGGYLSVASKAAAFALLVRFTLAFVSVDPGLMRGIYLNLGMGLGLLAAVTATYGNLAAYTQTNVKRLLAYSTIAHAGYMLMAVSAMIVILSSAETPLNQINEANYALRGLLYYLAVYTFMNLGAFAVVALIRNQIFSEDLADYKGLAYQCPVLSVCLMICFFSLVGIPPMGGFFAKLMIFASVYQATFTEAKFVMWTVLIVAGANTVFSLIYYINVLKAMFLVERPEGAREVEIASGSWPSLYVVLITACVVLLGIWADPISNTTQQVTQGLFLP